MQIFDTTLATLERALDARLERQTLLAGNLANADTPGFVSRDLDVARHVASPSATLPDAPGASPLCLSGSGGSPSPMPMLPAVAPAGGVPGNPAAPGLDGNDVDIDRTLAALAENALQYNAAARTAGKKLAILRYVASDGAA